MTMLGSDPSTRTWPRVWWVSSPDLVHWSDVVWGEPFGIDPHLFRDAAARSNKTYLTLMSPNNNYDRLWGISQCEVDLQSGKCGGVFRSLWNGTLPQDNSTRPEGPKLFHKDDYYYLVLAEGGTSSGHRVAIGRSKSPEGPWDAAPNNPLIYNGADPNLTVQSTGHATFVDTPGGDWYATMLARRNVDTWSPLGRETFLVSIKWEDGWPILNDGNPLLLSQSIGTAPDQERPPPPFVDNFDGTDLDLGWYQLRTPYTTNYKLVSSTNASDSDSDSASESGVILLPNVYTLGDRDTPAALIRKQTSLNMTFSATLLPTASGFGPRQSIGISAYINDHTHQDIGVRGCANATGLCLYMDFERNSPRPEDPPEETTEWALNATSIPEGLTLHIRAEPLTYKLGYSLREGDDENPTWMTEFSSQWLTEAPSGFSVFEGAMFVLFASGNGEPWPFDAPEVGFSRVREVYYEENIPDYIT